MKFGLMVANATPSVSIELGSAVAWFLRREIRNNDEAHRLLRTDVKVVEADIKQLLTGQVRVEGLLNRTASDKGGPQGSEHLLQQPSR